jgi:hypothetical protein
VIRPPKRAVTRFFIPLIDVLILLFGIFLFLPFVSRPEGSVPDPDADPSTPAGARSTEELRQRVLELELKLERASQEIARLHRDLSNPASRLSVRVLEIDPDTGRLYYFDPDSPEPRQEVRDQADAQRLIDQQRRLARGKDVFFLVLYPRKLTGFPLQQQVDAYRRWLKDVPHGFDNPWNSLSDSR